MKKNNNFLIKTPSGFEQFEGMTISEKQCVKITLSNFNSISCSYDHPFVINNKIIRTYDLKVDDELETKFGKVKIKKIENIGLKKCYDLINVGKNHIFYANDILTHNSFLGSSETLIKGDVIKKIRENFKKHINGQDIQLHKDFTTTVIKIYEPPYKNHAYVIGADPAMGTESDYHAMCVWDITNTFDIKQVASFYQNDIPPKIFAYILAKTGILYNHAYIAIENNGCSQVVLDALWRDFDYDNLVHEGGNPKTNIGIHSQNARKTEACLNYKLLLEDDKRKIQINDGRLIAEMEKFERKSRLGKMPTYEAADGHDDYMMSSIWGLYVLKMDILERYYDVKKTILNKLGERVPIYILPFESINSYDDKKFIEQIDEKLNNFGGEYQRKLNQIESQVNSEFMDQFIKTNNFEEYVDKTGIEDDENKNRHNEDDDEFHFRLFMPQ